MDKIEVRVVIKYIFFKGLTPTDIKKELDSTLKDRLLLCGLLNFNVVEYPINVMKSRNAQKPLRPTKSS